MEAELHVGANLPGNQLEALTNKKDMMKKIKIKEQLAIGLTAGVFSTVVSWALKTNAWLVLPAFLVSMIAIGWVWTAKFKRDWKKATLENTVNVTREQMHVLTNAKSREEFMLICALTDLDPKLLMKSFPFLRWDN